MRMYERSFSLSWKGSC